MDNFQKIPSYKRLLRALKILIRDTVFFPFRYRKFTRLINQIYDLEPLPAIESKVKEAVLEDIFTDIQKNKIILKDIESKYGSMTLEEIYCVAVLVKQMNPENIFEFGTFIGVTTLQMALNSSGDSKIFTLNLASVDSLTKYSIGHDEEEINLPSLQPGNRFVNSEVKGKITQLYGDSAAFDFSEFTDKMEFILVDASHEYSYVKSDTENSFKMLKKSGTIVWHDYPNAPGVYNYLNEIADKVKIYHIKDTHLAFTFNYQKH